jgi:hypothetical protein
MRRSPTSDALSSLTVPVAEDCDEAGGERRRKKRCELLVDDVHMIELPKLNR